MQTEPELGGDSEVACQPQGCISSDTAGAEGDFIDAPGIHTDLVRQPILAEVQGLDEFLEQYFPRMDRMEFFNRG